MVNPSVASPETSSPAVLLILPTYFPESYGGGEQQTRRFARALLRAGSSVTILAPRLVDSTLSSEIIDGVTIRRFRLRAAPNLGGRHILSFLAWWLQIAVWMRRHRSQFDIVHVIHARLHAVPAAVTGALLRKPVVAKIGRGGGHFDLSLVRNKRLIGRPMAFLLRRCISAFIANSRQIANDLETAGIEHGRIHRIPNGIDMPNAQNHADDAEGVCRFVCVGRLDPEKRLENMIAAFAALPATPKTSLTIVGDGQCRPALESLAAQHGIADRVCFAGAVDDVFPYLWRSDFYLSASESEGMSNALLEAMSCGVVPITMDVSGASDVVKHGVSGFVVSPADSKFEDYLLRAAHLPDAERMKMSNSAKQTIERNFAMASVARQQMDLYADLLPPLLRPVNAGICS